MPQRYTYEQKKQHMANWRASGLTQRQYCEKKGISFHTFRDWPSWLKRREKQQSRKPQSMVLPARIEQNTTVATEAATETVSDSVRLYLPSGYQIVCQPAQLGEIFQALKHAKV